MTYIIAILFIIALCYSFMEIEKRKNKYLVKQDFVDFKLTRKEKRNILKIRCGNNRINSEWKRYMKTGVL